MSSENKWSISEIDDELFRRNESLSAQRPIMAPRIALDAYWTRGNGVQGIKIHSQLAHCLSFSAAKCYLLKWSRGESNP
jgi:hypothetical protein